MASSRHSRTSGGTEPPVPTQIRRNWRIVTGLTLGALMLHLLGRSGRPLWLDEAVTHWTVQVGPLAILAGARTDGTPPLHFLLVWIVTRLFGDGEHALRLVSLVAAVAMVPAGYVVGRRRIGERGGVLAAAAIGASPLVHYYAVEARNYALLQLLVLLTLGSTSRALENPRRWEAWGVLSAVLALALYAHNWSVFLLPAPVVAALIGKGGPRPSVAARACAAAGLALVIYLPWLPQALESASQGVGDWIASFWASTPPELAVLRSLEVFGFGGDYPRHLFYLGQAPSMRGLSVATTLVALAGALWATLRYDPQGRLRVLWVFLLVPLLGACAYSFMRQPIYLVGRYDTIALPPFLLLFAAGLERLLCFAPRAGWLAPITAVGLAATSLAPYFGDAVVPGKHDVDAAAALIRDIRPEDVVVTTGLRRAVVEYQLHRAGLHPKIYSFPPEIADHPGWYSPNRILADPTLPLKGKRLAEALELAARGGKGIWVLLSAHQNIDRHLAAPLFSALALDPSRGSMEVGLFYLHR